MIEGKENPIDRHVAARCKSEALTGLSDSQLLGRFSDVGDEGRESAFRELVDRHGPMVMRVCRQVLRHPNDAFQATFLVLVVKARSIKVSESMAPWLPDPLSTQPPADCPLANTADLPPYRPISMAASAVTKVLAHFHGSGSATSQ